MEGVVTVPGDGWVPGGWLLKLLMSKLWQGLKHEAEVEETHVQSPPWDQHPSLLWILTFYEKTVAENSQDRRLNPPM